MPADVLSSAALYARFPLASARRASACGCCRRCLQGGFGGHVERPQGRAAQRRGKSRERKQRRAQANPCSFVGFGASGDLYRTAADPCTPSSSLAASACPMALPSSAWRIPAKSDERVPRLLQHGPRAIRRRRSSNHRPRCRSCSSASATSAASLRTQPPMIGSIGGAEEDRGRAQDPRQSSLLLGNAATRPSCRVVQRLGEKGLGTRDRRETRLAPHHHRKALRHRFNLGASAQQALVGRVSGIADLSHRSLPRQRTRAEPHGAPLRQRGFSESLWNSRRIPTGVQITAAEDGRGRRRRGKFVHRDRQQCATMVPKPSLPDIGPWLRWNC